MNASKRLSNLRRDAVRARLSATEREGRLKSRIAALESELRRARVDAEELACLRRIVAQRGAVPS